MLSFRHTEETSKNVADTTFKDGPVTLVQSKHVRFLLRDDYVKSSQLLFDIHNDIVVTFF